MVDATEKTALRLAAICSGGGTTLQNLLDRQAAGTLAGSVELVIASKPEAFAAERARRAGIPCVVVPPQPADAASLRMFGLCRERRIDFVLLAGYLHLLPIPQDFARRVLNIHPSLLPAFGGRGCYGRKVHEAALARGVKLSGCTVHFADQEYDHGPILVQRAVAVLADDTPETLAARVFAAECEAYPEAVRLLAAARDAFGRIS